MSKNRPVTLEECLESLDEIKDCIIDVVELFRLAAHDGDPNTFEAVDLERLAYGGFALPKKKRAKTERKPSPVPQGYMRPNEVSRLIGVSLTTIYRWVKNEQFPKPFKLGPRCSVWKVSEIDEWMHGNEAR